MRRASRSSSSRARRRPPQRSERSATSPPPRRRRASAGPPARWSCSTATPRLNCRQQRSLSIAEAPLRRGEACFRRGSEYIRGGVATAGVLTVSRPEQLKALGHPLRLRVLELLGESEEQLTNREL